MDKDRFEEWLKSTVTCAKKMRKEKLRVGDMCLEPRNLHAAVDIKGNPLTIARLFNELGLKCEYSMLGGPLIWFHIWYDGVLFSWTGNIRSMEKELEVAEGGK